MNNTSRALAALSVGAAVLLGALAAPASAAPVPGLGGVCTTLHGIPIVGAVGDVPCVLVNDLPIIGPIIGGVSR